MPRLRLLLVPLLTLALVVAACGADAPSDNAATTPGTATPATGTPATAAPTGTDGAPTDEPSTDPPAPTDEPVATEPPATEVPGSSGEPAASPTASDGPADACSGNDSNRLFFAKTVTVVAWPVLCAVLPKGWYVSAGTYHLANGGQLVIGYRGPAGATLVLSEGAFCADGSGCVPAGTDGEDVPFGPLTGTLIRSSDGGFAVVVDRGLNPSWLLEAHGLDEATTVALAAGLVEVAAQP